MVQLFESGAYLIDGKELIADNADAAVQVAAKTGRTISKEEAASTRMTICLAFPVHKNTAVSMYLRI